MAMFKGFKPQGLQKIASRMGYAGRMEEFDNYLEQNPEKQREMITYQAKAQEMANGGLLKFQPQNPGGETSKQAKFAPMYNQFKESDFYKDSQKGVGATVTGGAMVDGQNYNFGMRKEAEAYKKYLDSLGYGTQKVGEATYYNTPKAVAFGGAPVGRGEPILRGDPRFDAMPKVERMPQINNYTQGYTPGYVNPFPGMQEGPEADKFRKMAEDRRKQTAKAPTLEDVEKRYDMSTLDGQGFAVKLDSDGNPTRNREKVSFYKDRAQKKYDEQLAKHKEYQKIFGQNYTVGQAQDYDREQGIIKRNENLKQLNPKFDLNYYNSPEYKEFQNNPSNMMGTMDMRYSPYFGQQGSGSIGSAADRSYINYLKRTGQDTLIKEGVIPQDKRGDFGNLAGLISDSLPSEPIVDDKGNRGYIGGGSPPVFMDGVNVNANNKPTQIQQPINQIMPTFTPPPVQDFQAKLNIPPQPTGPNMATDTNIEDFSVQQALNPTLPQGGATVAADTPVTQAQMIDPNTGQLISKAPTVDTARVGTTTTSTAPTATPASTMDASLSNLNVTQALQPIQSAQGSVSQQAQLDAQQQTASKVSELKAAQGTATLMQNPVQRQVQAGELISGGVANAQTASTYAEQIQAAEATPSAQATVQGQLANLTTNFDASNPPAWAAGALRGIQAQMANRGLGASSIAAQAMVQGALESALPIAQADASTIASFEQANLSNRQQRAMLSAQQRATFIGQEFDQAFQTRVQNAAKIGDIANMNFTAEQNIALENSKAVNTMGLANLSNNQAMVIAEASALANLDMSNLNNRQQAAVQNAQSFMQMDMANLNNNQQTDMFKAQSIVQSLFNDQSATNASNQFNATSQNQTDQFFANLASTVANFNAEQANAMSRYNAGELNALEQFNSTMKNQREQFNAQNRLVIDQSNAQWRRQVATSDTATINRVNELNARALIELSTGAYNNLWQGFRDDMEFAWKTADNAEERSKDILLRKMQDESTVAAAALAADQQNASDLASGLVNLATSNTGSGIAGSIIDGVGNAAEWLWDLF